MQSPTVRYEPLLLRRLNRPWKQGAQRCDPTWWSTIKSWVIWAINNGGWVFSHRIICYIYIYWLVVWNINFMTFPSYWECHHPNWRTPSFFRGVGSTTNQYMCVFVYTSLRMPFCWLIWGLPVALYPMFGLPARLELCRWHNSLAVLGHTRAAVAIAC